MPSTSSEVHRWSGATIRCLLVVIGANQGDGGVGGGLRTCGEVGDGSGTTFRPAGVRGGLVRWAYALHQQRGAQVVRGHYPLPTRRDRGQPR